MRTVRNNFFLAVCFFFCISNVQFVFSSTMPDVTSEFENIPMLGSMAGPEDVVPVGSTQSPSIPVGSSQQVYQQPPLPPSSGAGMPQPGISPEAGQFPGSQQVDQQPPLPPSFGAGMPQPGISPEAGQFPGSGQAPGSGQFPGSGQAPGSGQFPGSGQVYQQQLPPPSYDVGMPQPGMPTGLEQVPASITPSGMPVVLPSKSAVQSPAIQKPIVQKTVAPKIAEEEEKIKKDRPAKLETVPSELKGIDTLEVDDPGGNWLIKRMWWEKAEKKMDKIEEEVDKIMSARVEFFNKRDNVDSETFDPFYLEVGLDQGQLEEIISYMVNELEERRKKYERLDRHERDFLKKIKAEKKTLSILKSNIVSIRELDNSTDDVIAKLVEQINLSRKYKKEARNLFKKIGRVLDHDKARELYYEMDASWQSIQKINNYIVGEFSNYFDQIIKQSKKQIDDIKLSMKELEDKGEGFKIKLKKIKDEESKKEEKAKELKKNRENIKDELEEGSGFFSLVITSIMSPIYVVWNWISSWWAAEHVIKLEDEAAKEIVEKEQAYSTKLSEPEKTIEKVKKESYLKKVQPKKVIAPKTESITIAPIKKTVVPDMPKKVKTEPIIAPIIEQAPMVVPDKLIQIKEEK